MHRGLSIPEILMGIFQCLESDSNARNARVCRQWTDPALDETWRVAEPEVFGSLAPMQVTSSFPSKGVQSLVRILPVLTITRFDRLSVT